jgi:hypothetical protein
LTSLSIWYNLKTIVPRSMSNISPYEDTNGNENPLIDEESDEPVDPDSQIPEKYGNDFQDEDTMGNFPENRQQYIEDDALPEERMPSDFTVLQVDPEQDSYQIESIFEDPAKDLDNSENEDQESKIDRVSGPQYEVGIHSLHSNSQLSETLKAADLESGALEKNSSLNPSDAYKEHLPNSNKDDLIPSNNNGISADGSFEEKTPTGPENHAISFITIFLAVFCSLILLLSAWRIFLRRRRMLRRQNSQQPPNQV